MERMASIAKQDLKLLCKDHVYVIIVMRTYFLKEE